MQTETQTETPASFDSLPLNDNIRRALHEKNYLTPSPIQSQAIPHLLQGRDLIGVAQTGTGKTAAFALPILHLLTAHPQAPSPRRVRALILTPTRELASQIEKSFQDYGRYLPLTHTVVFGGVGQHPQVKKLAKGIDILVATPGRLLDLVQQRHVQLDQVEIFVLDEADRMLDMGFVHDVKRLLAKLPAHRQALLFSATMPPAIQELAHSLLRNPVKVEVTPVATPAERIDQRVCLVDRNDKRKLLVHLIRQQPEGLVLVFVRMKHGANRLVEGLGQDHIRAEAIHGNKSQGARERALQNFRNGHTRVLVATDIAARGIDVKGIQLVVNFDIPEEPESYVHRIGRTARAGALGMAISLCDAAERSLLRGIERLIRKPITVMTDHPFVQDQSAIPEMAAGTGSGRGRGRTGRPQGGGRRSDGGRRFGRR
jgi:ATP-dependent RNA helicase RhlE